MKYGRITQSYLSNPNNQLTIIHLNYNYYIFTTSYDCLLRIYIYCVRLHPLRTISSKTPIAVKLVADIQKRTRRGIRAYASHAIFKKYTSNKGYHDAFFDETITDWTRMCFERWNEIHGSYEELVFPPSLLTLLIDLTKS